MSRVAARPGLGSLRWLALAWGFASLPLVAVMASILSMQGFPDGFITPYQRDVSGLRHGLGWAFLFQALAALALGVTNRGPRWLVGGLPAAGALILVLSVLVAECTQWSACRSAYETATGRMFDDGQGG